MAKREPIPPHIKRDVYAKCSGRCAYCGKNVSFKHMSIDHKIPISRGGTDGIKNLQCACKMCNWIKGNATPEEFVRHTWRMFVSSARIYLAGIFGKDGVRA